MTEATLLPELIGRAADRTPQATALTSSGASMTYAELAAAIAQFAAGLRALGLARSERVAIYLDKRFETVVASFGAPAAGGVFVPINPLLKPEQVAFILQDCNVRMLVTSPERLALLPQALSECPDLWHLIVTGTPTASAAESPALPPRLTVTSWFDLLLSLIHISEPTRPY